MGIAVGVHHHLSSIIRIRRWSSPARADQQAAEKYQQTLPHVSLSRSQELIRSGVVRAIPAKDAAAALRDEGFRLLDIRPAWEWDKARVRGSLHVPLFIEDTDSSPITLLKKWVHLGYIGLWTGQLLTTINDRFLPLVEEAVPDKKVRLLVACGEGLRSVIAVRMLHEGGYKDLGWLAGGFNRSQDDDFPDVEGGSKLQYATIGGVSYIFLQLLIFLQIMATNVKEALSVKPEKFDGDNFRRWQNQMKFYLTTLGLMSALENTTTPSSSRPATRHNLEQSIIVPNRTTQEIDYHCLHRILGALSDRLYDIYYKAPTAKTLWDTLDDKYGLDDSGIKRFKAADFNKFKMVDNKLMNEQIHEFEILVQQLKDNGTSLDETFQIACIIDKLPPSWSEFAKHLSHTQGDLSLTQVLNAIRIEEQHKLREKEIFESQPKINNIENKPNNEAKPKQKHSKRPFNQNYNKNFKRKPFQHNKNHNHFHKKKEESGLRCCFVCGRTNHLAKDCFYKKTQPLKPRNGGGTPAGKHQVNMVTSGAGSSGTTFRTQVEEL